MAFTTLLINRLLTAAFTSTLPRPNPRQVSQRQPDTHHLWRSRLGVGVGDLGELRRVWGQSRKQPRPLSSPPEKRVAREVFVPVLQQARALRDAHVQQDGLRRVEVQQLQQACRLKHHPGSS
jgi:hypothetical protein